MKYAGKGNLTIGGITTSYEIFAVGRKGTLSPISFYYKKPNSTAYITPFEIRARGYRTDVNITMLLLEYLYGDMLRELVYARNPFLQYVPKGNLIGSYLPVPINCGGTK